MYKMYKYKMYKYKCTNIPVIVYKCYLLKFILDFTTIYITFLQANNFIGVIYFFFFRQFQHVSWLWNREIYGRGTYRSHFGFWVTAVLYNMRISNTSINSRV